MASRRHSSLACIKFWLVVGSTMLLIIWVCIMQMASLDGVYKNNGYLIITPNGGLNQKRLGICDMVAIARYLNVTLIVHKFANGTYWNDTSTFSDIFDMDHFITSLRDEVQILKELPPKQQEKAESEPLYYMYPISFASLEYYEERVLPRIQKHEVYLFPQTDARLANNGLPDYIQRLRCRVNFEALKFTQEIEETGQKIVTKLREMGPFLALHLRYEKDILAFTGCREGLTNEEAAELKTMRYSHDGWQHRSIDYKKQRQRGNCPLTPEETALVLQALGIDKNTTIYMASGEIYKKEKRMAEFSEAYPNLVTKQTILKPEELEPFLNHADQMAALDYIVAIESDIFVPTYEGNMAKAVEGHRRYLGFKTTITLDRKLLFSLIDEYRNGSMNWDGFSVLVKKSHEERRGKPTKRIEIPDYPRQEDYFYSNPQECLPPFAQPSSSSSTTP